MLAALRIDPFNYLRSEDRMEVMAMTVIAEGANKLLNERDVALAKMIAQETAKLFSKMLKGGKKK